MERDWNVQDGSDCDLNALPLVRTWPGLVPYAETVERLVLMGAIEDDEIRDVLLRSPRGVHALPLPIGEDGVNIEGSALRMPWWSDVDAPNSLLPGIYETAQVIQMLEIERGDSVMLVAPRGNWWTEILMQLGVSRLRVVEVDEIRRAELQRRWISLRLDIVADACGCQIEWCGIEDLFRGTPEDGWDKILVTGGLPRVPVGLLMRLSFEGIAIAAIGENTGTVLQTITRQGEGEFQAQWLAIWNVDMIQDEIAQTLCDLAPLVEMPALPEPKTTSVKAAWMHANDNPTRDRLGPAALLEMIEEVWGEVEATTESEGIGVNLREVLAQDLFRMGNVLQRLGILRVAAEHHGTSFQLSPSPEAACYLGMTFADDEEDGLAWQRRAIETNPNYGGSWTDIGEALLQRGQAEMALKWFRGAINSVNYCERGAAWANLARAHLEMGQTTSALFAAQEAAALMPEEDELDELLDQLTDGLA
ncbi:MAG: hypothetical protein VX191_03015 [Candidatus Thermoplasmatota archaeon]|nr:hypothetical protein [Candidatus Thermoplasmatota archaeon]